MSRPSPDTRSDQEFRDDIERWLTKVWRLLAIALVLIAVGVIAGFIAFGSVTHQIQFERAKNTLSSCVEQNTRNATAKASPSLAASPPEVRAFAGELIDAVAPHRDCIGDVIVPRFGEKMAADVEADAATEVHHES